MRKSILLIVVISISFFITGCLTTTGVTSVPKAEKTKDNDPFIHVQSSTFFPKKVGTFGRGESLDKGEDGMDAIVGYYYDSGEDYIFISQLVTKWNSGESFPDFVASDVNSWISLYNKAEVVAIFEFDDGLNAMIDVYEGKSEEDSQQLTIRYKIVDGWLTRAIAFSELDSSDDVMSAISGYFEEMPLPGNY